MTVFRLATATVLLAGLALPVLAQGTTAAPASPAASGIVTPQPAMVPGKVSPVPAATLPPRAEAGTAASGIVTPQPAMVPGKAAAVPATLPPRAETGAETGTAESHARPVHAERTVRSHHRFASAMPAERASHGRVGEVAPTAIR